MCASVRCANVVLPHLKWPVRRLPHTKNVEGHIVKRLISASILSGALLTASVLCAGAASADATEPTQPTTTASEAAAFSSSCLYFQYAFHVTPTDPVAGQVVTYRMDLVNNGAVDSTKSEIVFGSHGMTDDTSLEPASLASTHGAATFDGETFRWRGPLDAGEKVSVTFTGVWTGSGDGISFPEVDHYGYAH